MTQSSISLIEYEQKLKELFHYFPKFVAIEEKNASCFEKVLRKNLGQAMVVLELRTSYEVLTKTQLVDFRDCSNGKNTK